MNVHPLVKAFLIGSMIAGCATPAQRFSRTARAMGLTSQLITGATFQHRLYLNRKALSAEKNELHVYLDGDGTPWERARWLSEDPTSRNSLILKLMNQDSGSALLLGRPCYHGLSRSRKCHFKYWTSHRYSQLVVDSLTSALQNWLVNRNYKKIVLIGFSGGGTLAVLLAEKLKKVDVVVTIAANLDVNYWSLHHGYPPLTNSLNPIELQPLPAHIKQLHFAGMRDKNVPSKSIENYANRQLNATYVPVLDYTHYCCWDESWSAMLKKYIFNE